MKTIKKILKKTFLYKPLLGIKNGIIHTFYPFGYIRNYVLFPIAGFLRINHIPPFYNKYKFIDDIRDKYKGKRCFIIATGPSLRMEDVDRLENEITIGMNSFYRIYDKTQFRPTFYVTLDPDVQSALWKNYHGDVRNLAKEMVFMNSIVKERAQGVNYLPYCYQNHWFKIFTKDFDYAKNLKFTKDLLFGIYDKYTITNAAIDLAIHLGCKEIYLIGVDCNYSGPTKYFVDPGSGTHDMNQYEAYCVQKALMTGYRFMEQETKKIGVKVYNATRGGMLEEFERIDFDEVLGKNV